MNNNDFQRIQHINRYCKDIADFIERFGNNFNDFMEDRAYFNAVSMSILQIGELANGLTEEFREKNSCFMPWGMIRGMRNWLAHAYAEMDESVIWETAINDIPKLRLFCEKTIRNNIALTEKKSVLEQLNMFSKNKSEKTISYKDREVER